MNRKLSKNQRLNILLIIVGLLATLSLSLIPDTSLAKRGGDDNRIRYRGIVESRPAQGTIGEWVIGGRSFHATPRTEIDQSEGVLAIGSCAKVDIRNGQVHEIDSEPLRDC